METPVTILDYGAGNVGSMARALTAVGADVTVASDAGEAGSPERLVLPGVGRFKEVMAALRERGFDDLVRGHAASGRPFLGVCVGLQVLFESSAEDPGEAGLAIVGGTVERFSAPKVPQVGFNLVEPVAGGIIERGYYYFVNSYHAVPADRADVAAESDYHGTFVAAITRGPLLALQFHPEKSGPAGLSLLRGWLAC